MQRWHRLLTLGFAAAACLLAQSATGIDNDQVRVVTVTDQPHVKSKLHEHPFNRVMVYLRPGRQEIISADGKKTTLTWNAGDVKWSPASGMHTSEVISDAPVTIVELEVKKPGDPAKKITTTLDPLKVAPKNFSLIFENEQVRALRLKLGPHESVPTHEYTLSHLTVCMTDLNARLTAAGGAAEAVQHKTGDFKWSGPSQEKIENLSDQPLETVVLEMKTIY